MTSLNGKRRRRKTSIPAVGFSLAPFQKLKETGTLTHPEAPRNFGLALVLLCVGMRVVGIVFHVLFMLGPRAQREEMAEAGLIHAQSGFPALYTLTVAVALLAVGVTAIISMTLGLGPFG